MSKQGSFFLEQISRKGLGQNLRGSLVESSVGLCFFCMDHSSKSVLQVCVTGGQRSKETPVSWGWAKTWGTGGSLALHSHGPSVWEPAKGSSSQMGLQQTQVEPSTNLTLRNGCFLLGLSPSMGTVLVPLVRFKSLAFQYCLSYPSKADGGTCPIQTLVKGLAYVPRLV